MKPRNNSQRLRAERARRRTDDAIIDHIAKLESKQVTKQLTYDKQPEAPVRENPHDRILRKLREANGQTPSGTA